MTGGDGGTAPFAWPPPTPIWACRERRRACVRGTVCWHVREASCGIVLSVLLEDETGRIRLVFFGRRSIPGLVRGATVRAEGMVGRFRGVRAMLNPRYELLG